MNRAFLFIPLVGFIAMGILFWIGLGQEDKTSLPSPLIGKPFPTFILNTVESGESTNHLPQEPVLVNVWATWCPTCKAEHAFLNELAKEGVKIVGINYKDDDFKARQWLQAYGNPYLFNIADPDGKLGLELGVYGAPETFLVDSKGIIRAKHIGDLNPAVWDKLQPQFEAMQ
ncbi:MULTISPECIES: DsbE family thiol:disulfide interchange protein [Oceanospirillaceae]|jgi:cytochrome c biogenesis protein CcmG/thiol:disulfide interchange protein DsbE|uniref:DsbE family thiol:disulfide interchange protein n=1 Tax=Oceanospirillaceae TaxID=135620 RepID=UPI000C471CFF|nr:MULTISPECIES: DsbE family thiol:disulfide interchange protein [Thalassolituus]MBU2039843.1 DsbE family thiol:disulfide interchange protein [Gammaproteobacteria bacterium]PIQ42268.1 MAG: DsbE family thiol:disulfide interchange protein [Thalassolituus sp. CG17_big_fil_post_rev_8_21_14_2_50_53_8]MCA6059583.1 DsbE family thiol:disulfide interchange protein [Thalassolituus sp. ST750PaO-4]MCB2385501.1 DsbE family thiol:disulfide interchange protein [Thalassolituus alkanivorans]MCB2423243.1 DsbE f|tara:strand:- start:309 stop:824 length:516 start_codon:yes stop_codon:yes gene_type:complete